MNSSCKLCSTAPETRQHFISECVFLKIESLDYIEKVLKDPALHYIHGSQVNNPEFLTQLTLDVSAVLEIEQCDQENWGLLKLQTREYINKIHHKRLTELKRLSIFWAKWDNEHHSNVWWKKKKKKKNPFTSVYRAHAHVKLHRTTVLRKVSGGDLLNNNNNDKSKASVLCLENGQNFQRSHDKHMIISCRNF